MFLSDSITMDMQMKLDDGIIATMFSAGAYSALEGRGMSSNDADAFVAHVCKEASSKSFRYDEDEDDTWWSRNKGWALPTAIGAGAFILGADAGRNGRPDRSPFSNAGNLLWERVKALLGVPDSALWRSMTETRAPKSNAPEGSAGK
jgi:hypothetical protein